MGTIEQSRALALSGQSMRGQELDEMFAGFSGVYGDRLFAFRVRLVPRAFLPDRTGNSTRCSVPSSVPSA